MNKKRYRKDIVLSVGCVVAAVLFYLYIIPAQIRIVQGSQNEVFSPDTFPRLLTIVFIVCAVVNALSSALRLAKARREEKRKEEQEKALPRNGLYPMLIPYLMFAVAVLYVFLFQRLGFLWATIIVPPLILLLLKCRKWYFYVITYLFAALMYALFRLALQVPLR